MFIHLGNFFQFDTRHGALLLQLGRHVLMTCRDSNRLCESVADETCSVRYIGERALVYERLAFA